MGVRFVLHSNHHNNMNIDDLVENKNLKRSNKFLKHIGYLVLFILLNIFLIQPFVPIHYFFVEFLSSIPIIVIFILSPIGLIYSIKSLKHKEGTKLIRFRIFYSHTIIFLLLLLFIKIIITDIRNLF